MDKGFSWSGAHFCVGRGITFPKFLERGGRRERREKRSSERYVVGADTSHIKGQHRWVVGVGIRFGCIIIKGGWAFGTRSYTGFFFSFPTIWYAQSMTLFFPLCISLFRPYADTLREEEKLDQANIEFQIPPDFKDSPWNRFASHTQKEEEKSNAIQQILTK